MTYQTEYNKGYKNGTEIEMSDPGYGENILKSEQGISKSEEVNYPLVYAYWRGYRNALADRGYL